jgi:serine/threonine protein kinase
VEWENHAGHIVLSDFGLSKQLTEEVPESKTMCSNATEYMAPETLRGEGQTKAVDWWNLGVLMSPFYSQDINTMFQEN